MVQRQRQVMMIDDVVLFLRAPDDGNQMLAEEIGFLSIRMIAPALALGGHLAHAHCDLSRPQSRYRHGMNARLSE
jgi:hypothetical protein